MAYLISFFKNPKLKNYEASVCSISFLMFILSVIFVIIFPFLAAFASQRFWIRDSLIYTTPIVNYYNNCSIGFIDNNFNNFIYKSSINKKDFFDNYNLDIVDSSVVNNNKNNNYPLISNVQTSYSTTDSNMDNISEKINISFSVLSSFIKNIRQLDIKFILEIGLEVSNLMYINFKFNLI